MRKVRVVTWLAAIACLVGAIIIAIWPLPELLMRDAGRSLTTADRLKAENDVRSTLLALVAGLTALTSVGIGLRTYGLARSGQFTDRFTRATEQLGSAMPSVQLGGIYALGRLAQESNFDRQAVADVLAAVVKGALPLVTSDSGESGIDPVAEAAMTVLGRGWASEQPSKPNVGGAHLASADLRGQVLRGFRLRDADLSLALLQGADLRHADLTMADLRGADLSGADLRDALLNETDLRGARLTAVKTSIGALTYARTS